MTHLASAMLMKKVSNEGEVLKAYLSFIFDERYTSVIFVSSCHDKTLCLKTINSAMLNNMS